MAHSGKSITFATDLLPNENNTYNLGNNDNKWKLAGGTVTDRLVLNRGCNNLLIGTGTAGSYTNSTYYPAKWTFNMGANPIDGDIITIKIPIAGHDYGVFLSTNNGTTYYPIVLNGTSRLTTHYPVNTYITLIFESNGSATSMYALEGQTSSTRITVSGGAWRVINYYDSNETGRTYSHGAYLTSGNFRVPPNSIIGFDRTGKALSISLYQANYTSSTVNTNTARVYNTNGFDYTRGLWYTNSGSNFAANTSMNISPAILFYCLDLRYTDNCIASSSATTLSMTPRKPVYLRGTIDSDGLFYLAPLSVTYNGSTYKRAWTQDIPTAEESNRYVYWFIGYAYYNGSYANGQYQLNLHDNNPLYWFHNGRFEEYQLIDNSNILDNSLPRNKLMMTDTLNYAELNDYSCKRWGFTADTTTDGHWYTMDSLARDKFISNYYSCNGEETFNIQFEISTTCKGNTSSGGTDSVFRGTAIGLYTYNEDNTSTGIVYSTRTTADANGTVATINSDVTIAAAARRFRVFVQTESHGNFSGTIKIRKVKVIRVSAPKWYGNLSGNATTATTAGNVTGTVAIANGGTGKTTAADAWTALGGGASGKHADNYFSLSEHTHTLNIAEDTGTNALTLAYGKKYKLTAGGSTYIFTMPSSDNTNTATAADNILDGSNSGTQITYKPYTSQQTDKLSFDTSSTAPARTDRLNLNGYLYATKLYSGGTEVSVSGHTHSYLPLSGGTLTGALITANNTWNTIGDDAYLGDINKAGHIGIQGKNGNTGIFFTTYNQTNKTTGGAITWDGTKFSITSTTAIDASISGNAATATTATNLSAAPTITATGTATVNLAANTTYTLTVGGKSVIFKTPADANTNTLMNYTLGATTRAYLMGSQNAPTTTTTARAAHGDMGVYLTATAGQLSAKSFSLNDGTASASSVEKVWMQWNSTDSALEFIFA